MITVTELREDLEDPATTALIFETNAGKLYRLDQETKEELTPVLKYWERQGLGNRPVDFSETEWFFVT